MSLASRSVALTGLVTTTVLLAGCGQLGAADTGSGRRAVASFYPLA